MLLSQKGNLCACIKPVKRRFICARTILLQLMATYSSNCWRGGENRWERRITHKALMNRIKCDLTKRTCKIVNTNT